ncbi:MAG: hypothetical protein NT018_10585 [Armatimonadetes bacterium]|nr:hypothetical protein [Armatimonadota bacterium]
MADDAIVRLEDELNSFDSFERADALCSLSVRAEMGEIVLPRTSNKVNLHFHTFFSYNVNGWSPSRIAWESAKHGLLISGIVDFDVLDGTEEFLAAGELIHLRTTAALETRVFISEYFDKVINSPNEPGIAYFMAAGCFKQPPPGSPAHDSLRQMREMAERRNTQVMERVNAFLQRVQLDYEADVIPLTPSGNATERHLLAAYDAKAREVFLNDECTLAAFWANALEISCDEAAALVMDTPNLHENMRAKLMKFGGVGYVSPSAGSFPSVEQVIEMALGMQAIPTATWLDGANPGESDMPAMFELLASKGVAALNIIPDRNWNIKNSDEKAAKLANLQAVVEAAREIGFPICIGTEMNKVGLPFVDDFSAPELAPFIEDFVEGANFFWGHTALARNVDIGFSSEWADHHFGDDRLARSRFYANVGKIISPNEESLLAASNLRTGSPIEVLRALQR